MKRQAFTLVELLIVIGLIAILVGLTVPSFTTLRNRAQTAQCVSNLSQWGKALQMYAIDNDGYLPLRGQGVQPVFLYNRTNDWFNCLTVYLDMPRYMDLYSNGMTPKAHEHSVFVCPAADASGTAGSSNFITYGMNIFISRPDQPHPARMGGLPNISTLAFMADAPGGYASTVPAPYAYSTVARHGGKANVCFFDGHVQSFAGDYLGCGSTAKVQPDVHWRSGLPDDTWTPY